MSPTPTARLFKLSPDLWAKLEAIAAANGTLAATGPTAGQPSVHALLGAIAAGDLVVVSAETAKTMVEALADMEQTITAFGTIAKVDTTQNFVNHLDRVLTVLFDKRPT